MSKRSGESRAAAAPAGVRGITRVVPTALVPVVPVATPSERLPVTGLVAVLAWGLAAGLFWGPLAWFAAPARAASARDDDRPPARVRLELPDLVVRDMQDGRLLAGFLAGLVDGRSGRVVARWEAGAPDAPRTAHVGDRLFVHARGYGCRDRTLAAPSATAAFELPRASRTCVVRIEGDGVAELIAQRALRVRVRVETEGAWPRPAVAGLPGGGRAPIVDRHEFDARAAVFPVRWGDGLEAVARIEAEDGIVWPLWLSLRDGEEAVARLEPGRPLRVTWPRRADGGRLDQLEVLPDLTWSPGVPPARVDAWRWHMNDPAWLEQRFTIAHATGVPAVRVLPDVAFHLFSTHGGRPHQLRVEPGTAAIDLSRPAPPRALAHRPVIGGHPLEGEALIAAGRLDRITMAELYALRRALRGFVHEVPPRAAPWQSLELPASRWLTVLHREHGLAHLAWPDEGVPVGAWFEGTLELRVPDGCRVTGTLLLYPVWRGEGATRTAPPSSRWLRQAWDGGRVLAVRGLRPARYGVDLALAWTRVADGTALPGPRFVEGEVKGDPPRGKLLLRPRSR